MAVAPRNGSQEPGPPHKRAGRPPILSLDRIVDAGVELGLDQLSVVAVAQHLGVGGSSLYRHIGGADDLAERVAERVIQSFEPPDLTDADLKTGLTAFGWAIHEFVERNPGFSGHVDRLGPPPTMRAHIETLTDEVHRLGLERPKAALALADIASFADGGWWPGNPTDLALDPHWDPVPELAESMRTVSPGEYFRWLLDLHIDGLLRALDADDLPWSRRELRRSV